MDCFVVQRKPEVDLLRTLSDCSRQSRLTQLESSTKETMVPPPFSETDDHHDTHDFHLDGLDGILDDVNLHLSPSQLSPALGSASSPGSPDSWRLANAVHMEIQENAKLPTFYSYIDRSGSVTVSHPVKPMVTNLSESFLANESRRRRRHTNYGHLLDIPDPTPLEDMKHDLPFSQSNESTYIPRHVPLPIPNIGEEKKPTALDTAAALATMNNDKNKEKNPVINKPNLEMASKQQTQYGFGKRHVVPSVPALQTTKKTSRPSSRASISPRKRLSPAQSKDDSDMADAYERKKQRAKNARVKLNESIDRLSIAIGMAGTQSKQRLSQLEGLVKSKTIGTSPHFKFETTQHVLQDCIKTSEDAKKWDRPSFVGSAAILIECLNAQCEALMREITVLSDTMKTSDCASTPTKRRRMNGHTELLDSIQTDNPISGVVDQLVFKDSKIMENMAAFLDPLSIVRCMRVSKAWRDWGTKDYLWHKLAMYRFGVFHVRQWEAKLEDTEDGVPPPSPTTLYKTMDALNVMPYKKFDGNITMLGEARLPGKASAWCFMVERSNGETMRSVERPPETTGTGVYTSLPVVQLWIVIQNTGIHNENIVLKEQTISVDSSTRRRGEEMKEIEWDDRFQKRILNLDGSVHQKPTEARGSPGQIQELCRLRLFDSVIVETNIYAKGCTTASKFMQRSNFTKVLVQIRDGTTIPLVIPFPKDRNGIWS